MTGLLPTVIAMLSTGLVAGLLAGLFGVGGGIVIVPLLDYTLGLIGTDPAVRMHIAVATSLATVIFTSLSCTCAHYRHSEMDQQWVRSWSPWILTGSIAGTLVASRLQGQVLSMVFGVMALLLAVTLGLFQGASKLESIHTGKSFNYLIPTSIGSLSSMIGSGGTFIVPALILLGMPMRQAIATSGLFAMMIALPGVCAYIIMGWADARLPEGNLGYVSLYGLLLIAPMAVLAVPYGARLAHRLSQQALSRLFVLFLVVMGLRMLLREL